MRCNECNYPLWNTPAGNCPECGIPFKPSTHAFAVGEVRFRCPDCEQDYFGDDVDGHLRPPEFDCVSCGRRLHEDDCLLFPAEGDMDAVAEVRMPWMDLNRGRFKRWWGTIGWSMTQPAKLMLSVPLTTGAGPGVGFTVANLAAILVVGIVPMMLFFLVSTLWGTGGMAFGLATVGSTAIVPVGFMVLALVQIAVAHGLLVVTGGTSHGFSRTALAVLLGTGPMIIMAVPCIGGCMGVIAVPWWLISSIVMLKVGQEVHGARAALSMLLVPLGVVVLYVGVVTYGIMGINSRPMPVISGAGLTGSGLLSSSIQTMYEDDGMLPDHLALWESDGESDGLLEIEPHAFVADGAEGWWSGAVLTVVWPEDSDAGILILILKDGQLRVSKSNAGGQRLTTSSGRPLKQMVEGVQDGQREDGLPTIPVGPLDAWVEHQAE